LTTPPVNRFDGRDVHTIGVAIAVPSPWGEDLQEARAGYGDTTAWTIPTHVTLLPPTQVPDRRMDEVDRHLADIASDEPAFRIELGGAETFRPVTPTAYLRLSSGADACRRLASRVRSGPLRRRLPYDYHPHVTLAFDLADDILDRAVADFSDFAASFESRQFSRFEVNDDGIWLAERDFDLSVLPT